LFSRFIGDIQADGTIPEQVSGLKRSCAAEVDAFFEESLYKPQVSHRDLLHFLARTNRVASWANLGYVEEVVIRDRILQSLSSFPKLHDHQADALIILFRLAGSTFEAYVDPSVVDRSFELLKNRYYQGARGKLVLVSMHPRTEKPRN
jgi:hypothetical protein